MTDSDLLWLSSIHQVVAASAPTLGLDPDELMDVDEDEGGAGVDFMSGLDDLAEVDPADPTFALRVQAQVEAYAARQGAEPIAAKFQEYNDSAHPHKPSGPGGGQFATTNTSSSSTSARAPLTYSGTRQGTNKGGGSGSRKSQYDPVAAVKATSTLRNDGKGTNDPAAVTQLQHLLNELGLAGLNPNGVYGDSTEAAIKQVQAKLGMKPTGAASPSLIAKIRDAHILSPCVNKGTSQVKASAFYVEAAAGHDVTPGNDELRDYWLVGAGAARWRTWTELLVGLVEEIHDKPLETLKEYASRWFFMRYGFYAGDDRNRVMNGKPPRGKIVGPDRIAARASYPGQRWRHGWIPVAGGLAKRAAPAQVAVAKVPNMAPDPRPPHLRKYPMRNPGFAGPTYWRVQSADRDPDNLLEPDHVSYSWDSEDVFNQGTSTTETPEELAEYLAQVGIPIGNGNWVLVEVAGDDLGPGRDRMVNERLVQVDQIVSVRPLDDEFFDMVGAAYDRQQEKA